MTDTFSVADVCLRVTDGTHYTPPDVGSGIPFLTVKDMTSDGLDFVGSSQITQEQFDRAASGGSTPQIGDVLFSKDGTVGKVHVVEEARPFAVLSSIAVLTPRPGVDSRYLGHYLRTPTTLAAAGRMKTGSAIRRIILSDLKRLRLPLPPVGEQRRIADILDRADALRAKRCEACAHLNDLPQSLFREMFGDSRTVLNRWPTKPFGSMLSFLTSGSRGWARYYHEHGDKFLRIQNVLHDELALEDVVYVRAPINAEAKRTRVRPGDVLLSITADLGRVAVVPEDLGTAYINQHLSILRSTHVNPTFLSSYLSSPSGQRQILGRNRQGVKAGLNFDDIRSFVIPLPPSALQKQFETAVSEVSGLRESQKIHLNGINAMFASLQRRAFAGEL